MQQRRTFVIGFRRILFFVGMQSISFCSFGTSEDFTKNKVGIEVYGGYLQHHLVDEAISVLQVMDAQDLNGNLKEAIVDFVNGVISAAKDGDVITASRTLDACWAILDFANVVAYYAHPSLANNRSITGVMIKNVDEVLCFGGVSLRSHRVVKTYDIIQSYVIMAYYLGKLAHTIGQHRIICDVLEMSPEIAEETLKKYSIDSVPFLTIYEYPIISEKSTVGRTGDEEYLRLLRGITKILSIISQESLPIFLSCLHKGMQSYETAEDMFVVCLDEIQSLICLVEKVSGVDVRSELING
jgi:hypothetical protein